jgi:hypothetical protein
MVITVGNQFSVRHKHSVVKACRILSMEQGKSRAWKSVLRQNTCDTLVYQVDLRNQNNALVRQRTVNIQSMIQGWA